MDKGMLIAWAVRILGTILAAKLGMEASDAATTAQQLVDGGLAVATGAWVLYSVIRHILEWRKKVAGTLPSAVLFLPLVLVLAGGCMGGHDFQMAAPKAIVEIAAQLDTGIGEYHAAENTQLLAAEAQAKDRLQTALAEYVLKVARAGGTATVDDAKAAIAPAFANYDKDMAGITGDRQTESDRWRNMLELTEFTRRVARQIAEIETERYATYDELRALAKQAVSQAMTAKGGAK